MAIEPPLSTRSVPQLLLYFVYYLLFITPVASVEVTTTLIIPAPTRAFSSSYTSDREFRNTMLSVTNRYRREHHANAVKWNNSLANTALDWAKKCKWEHSHGPTGENLAMGFKNAAGAVEAWGDERDFYDFDGPTGFAEKTGHFTQLVWGGTTSVGCARVDCAINEDTDDGDAHGWYVVCEYWPPGNVLGNDLFKSNVLSADALETADDESAASALRNAGRYGVWIVLGISLGIAVLL